MQINLIYFFFVNFEHVFFSWVHEKIPKAAEVHIKHWGSFFKTYTCDMSQSTWFK